MEKILGTYYKIFDLVKMLSNLVKNTFDLVKKILSIL